MAVRIGSARIDENGRANGGKAGDQTGNEVGTQNWYKHGKGWRVLRPKSSTAAEAMARAMQAACDNRHIGYNQSQRNTLYAAAKAYNFDPGKVTKDVNTDCSALVRVCCAYAGIMVADFITSNEATTLLKSGAFTELTDSKYTDQSAYLRRGDVLVTKTKGHTVIVLSDGSKVTKEAATGSGTEIAEEALSGVVTVKDVQKALTVWDKDCLPRWGVDGEWGSETEAAVKAFQASRGIKATGELDAATLCALGLKTAKVYVFGGTVNVRSAPDASDKENILGTVEGGSTWEYQGVDKDGWHLIAWKGKNAWISGKWTEVR